MSKHPKIGDIVEIPLDDKNFGYAQYTHKHKRYGALIRVFKIREKINQISELSDAPHQFTTFFPLGPALKQNIISIVGNLPLRKQFEDFPIFRAGVANKSGEVEVWWLWDGEKETRIGKLTTDQMNYPIRGIINDTLLIERIYSGWLG